MNVPWHMFSSSSIGLSQDIDTVQKILVTLTGTIPLTLFTTSEEYSSRHVREPPNLCMCEVRPAPFPLCVILSWMQSAGHSHVQVPSVSWERLDWNRITAQPQAGRAEDPTLRKARVVFCDWKSERLCWCPVDPCIHSFGTESQRAL